MGTLSGEQELVAPFWESWVRERTDILAVGNKRTRIFDTSSISFVFFFVLYFLLGNLVKGNVYNGDSFVSPPFIIDKPLTYSSKLYSLHTNIGHSDFSSLRHLQRNRGWRFEELHPTIKVCIKQLSPNRSSIICETKIWPIVITHVLNPIDWMLAYQNNYLPIIKARYNLWN